MINLIAVDDEADTKILYMHFFKKDVDSNKINFQFVEHGAVCLDILASLEGQIVVVTDINMPEMNGIELLQQVNQKYPEVKVLIVSAYDEKHCASQLENLSYAGFISKPIDFDLLKSKIYSLSSK